MLYYLDRYFEKQNVFPRTEKIKELWEVITRLLQSDFFPENYMPQALYHENWDLSDPIGPLKSSYCNHSALWVCEWISMEEDFLPIIHVMGNEDMLRMNIAMNLLLGDHNENREMLVKNANYAWMTRK